MRLGWAGRLVAAGADSGRGWCGTTGGTAGGAAEREFAPLATLAPALDGRKFDIQPVDLRPGDVRTTDDTAPPSPSAPSAPLSPTAPSDTTADLPPSISGIDTPAPSSSAPPPTFAGELDAWNPSRYDDQAPTDEEPMLLARAGQSDAPRGYQGGIPPGRSTTGAPIPRLDPVTGLPLERVTTGSNMMPTNEWRPMPSQSEAELAALIDKQSRANQLLTPLEQGRLDAANWVKLERAQAGGASEGNGYVTDDKGNIRTFELDRNNRVLLRVDERVEPTYSYRNGNGDIVHVSHINQVPPGINPNNVVTGRALYYRDQLIARDFAVPQAYADAVAAQQASGGDPVSSLRRQVAVSPTGPFAELANFIDRGSGQVNPLDWDAFKARALEIVAAQGQQVNLLLTSNGMLNTYQQANANATGLANLTPNAIVVNVLNPSTGFSALDVADVIATHLGSQQAVAAALIEQIREARGFQSAVAERLSKDGVEVAPQNVLLVAHSQGTVNANQALEQLVEFHKERIADINVMYVGTAVNRVPIGLANLSNVTDLADPVSTRHTRGIAAITSTFLAVSNAYDELSFPSTPATEAVGQIPDSYRQLTTNFNAEPRANPVTANSVATALPTGNNHSLYLYLARRDVQRELARLLNVSSLNHNNRPIIPTYTGIPDDRPGG